MQPLSLKKKPPAQPIDTAPHPYHLTPNSLIYSPSKRQRQVEYHNKFAHQSARREYDGNPQPMPTAPLVGGTQRPEQKAIASSGAPSSDATSLNKATWDSDKGWERSHAELAFRSTTSVRESSHGAPPFAAQQKKPANRRLFYCAPSPKMAATQITSSWLPSFWQVLSS